MLLSVANACHAPHRSVLLVVAARVGSMRFFQSAADHSRAHPTLHSACQTHTPLPLPIPSAYYIFIAFGHSPSLLFLFRVTLPPPPPYPPPCRAVCVRVRDSVSMCGGRINAMNASTQSTYTRDARSQKKRTNHDTETGYVRAPGADDSLFLCVSSDRR